MIKLTTTVPKRKDLLSKRAKTENVSVKRLKQIKPLSPILDALTGYKKDPFGSKDYSDDYLHCTIL